MSLFKKVFGLRRDASKENAGPRKREEMASERTSAALPRPPAPPPLNPAPQFPVPSYKRFPDLPGSDPEALAQIGKKACERLLSNGARRLPALNMEIFAVPGFLSVEECSQLMTLIDEDVRPSSLLTRGGNDGRRTSQTCKLRRSDPLVAEVENRMADLLGLPLSHSETVQGQRYLAGQQFKMHNDYYAGGQPYSAACASEGGQRTWTAMVFLNEPEAGGATHFPRARVRVQPQAGTLLTWNNNDRSGHSNPYTHHEGMKVDAGTKYILTKWFREREWQSSEASDAHRVN